MKTKSKLITAALIATALVLAFTAGAGCVGEDPITGIYVVELDDSSKAVLEFLPDGTLNGYAIHPDGYVNLIPTSWVKSGDNRYESGLAIFKFGADDYTLIQTEPSGKSVTYTKYSNYVIPPVTTKDSVLYKNHQMIGTWKTEVDSLNYMIVILNKDGSSVGEISSNGRVSKFVGNWGYELTTDGGMDMYSMSISSIPGAIGHMEGSDYCLYSRMESTANPMMLYRV